MGGAIDWQALPILIELRGVPDDDLESLIRELITLREFNQSNRGK